MKKRLLSLFLALAMCLSLSVPAFAATQNDSSLTPISNSSFYIHAEKVGEDSEYVYFSAEIPRTSISVVSNASAEHKAVANTIEQAPVLLAAGVNKAYGYVIVTITVSSAHNIKAATCSYVTVTGAMGIDSHSNLSATNLIPFPQITINDTLDDLESGVETGRIYINFGTGHFSGPNVQGGFSGGTIFFDLEEL